MIKEFKNICEQSERAKFLRLGYKVNNWRIEKKHGSKTATRQNIGAPLPMPM